jgi:hypothetical protein
MALEPHPALVIIAVCTRWGALSCKSEQISEGMVRSGSTEGWAWGLILLLRLPASSRRPSAHLCLVRPARGE